MNLFEFGRLIYRSFHYILIIPVVMAAAVFIFTMNQPKEYAVSSLIYTGIASGFDIESGASEKVDYHAVNNAFDNMISIIGSRETKEQVLLTLLSHHLILNNQEPFKIPKDFKEVLTSVIDKISFDATLDLARTRHLLQLDYNDYGIVYDVINGLSGPYSIPSLSSLQAKRHKSSDMLVLYYKSTNPYVAQLTLELVIDIFSNRYTHIKEAETGNVVSYFENQLNLAKEKLNAAEDRLTEFRTGTLVINYGEQTKAIAIKKQNALEEFSRYKMNLKASEAALQKIEEKLAVRENLLTSNAKLLDKRNQLAHLTRQMALLQHDSAAMDSDLQNMRGEIENKKNEIQAQLELIFNYSNSKEGLPSQQLLNEWLQTLIEMNKDIANVEYFQNRLSELQGLYKEFAPLGSTLARLEREISVAEKEYLEILYGLNMSKLKQQNIELSSTLTIIDWPQMPNQPIKSKRKLLVIAAFVAGLVGVMVVLIGGQMLDQSLRTPSNAEKITGMKLLGAMPSLNTSSSIKYPEVTKRLLNSIVGKLHYQGDRPKIIAIGSFQPKEGKKTLTRMISHHMTDLDIRHKVIIPSGDEIPELKSESYEFQENLTRHLDPSIEFLLVVLPHYAEGIVPHKILKQTDCMVIVARADRSWTIAQKKMKKEFSKLTESKPLLLLNGVKSHHLDQLIGDLPNKRIKLIQWIRRILKMEFLGNALQ